MEPPKSPVQALRRATLRHPNPDTYDTVHAAANAIEAATAGDLTPLAELVKAQRDFERWQAELLQQLSPGKSS